ncbi:DUF222 domain-containing protein [Protofrankia symbiont of Coriaria ruscifolia]|uniref:DUF222 domain-containing protein n=1 Tax=Protofrankia symbiont of Coriaria ruscifolia TaxID=1306542 RepID=UPI001041AAF6|nr:DUF222 domain-containing protein [Protofrankia symbiont of Coriaria ruscifolia]
MFESKVGVSDPTTGTLPPARPVGSAPAPATSAGTAEDGTGGDSAAAASTAAGVAAAPAVAGVGVAGGGSASGEISVSLDTLGECDADGCLMVMAAVRRYIAGLEALLIRAQARFAALRNALPAADGPAPGRPGPDAAVGVGLFAAQAAAVEAKVLALGGRASHSLFRQALRRAVLAVDPDEAVRRHARAHQERQVRVRPVEDEMAELWALLPAADAQAAYQRLDLLARAAASSEDSRGMDARRADVLVDVLLGRDRGADVSVEVGVLVPVAPWPGRLTPPVSWSAMGRSPPPPPVSWPRRRRGGGS